MPVRALRLERKMRGGAQAHLLAADDGCFYVTKFLNNPQGRRILINEWIGGALLSYMGVSAPALQAIELTSDFLAATPDVHLQLGAGRRQVEAGWHLGSRFPGSPHLDAVYDFLPDSLLPGVANVIDFLGALVFDKWTANADSRQAIFGRARLKEWVPTEDSPTRKGFVAWMVDQGYAFDGPNWTFADAPLQGLYFRPGAYLRAKSMRDFEPWLARVKECPSGVFDGILKTIPRSWVGEDESALEKLVEKLYQRRGRVESRIGDAVKARPQLFPQWGR